MSDGLSTELAVFSDHVYQCVTVLLRTKWKDSYIITQRPTKILAVFVNNTKLTFVYKIGIKVS